MKLKQLVLTGLFAAFTAVCAIITIPLPVTLVPINLALLAVFLTGALLPKGAALGAQAVYLLLGLVGVPVFAGFAAGPGTLMGPTGGYLIAYPVMAFLIALVKEKSKGHFSRIFTIAAMVAALVICYLLGTSWYAVVTGRTFAESLALAVLPFILPDTVKLAVAYLASVALEKPLARIAAVKA